MEEKAELSPLALLKFVEANAGRPEPRCANCVSYDPSREPAPAHGHCLAHHQQQIPDGICLSWEGWE